MQKDVSSNTLKYIIFLFMSIVSKRTVMIRSYKRLLKIKYNVILMDKCLKISKLLFVFLDCFEFNLFEGVNLK